VYFHNPFSFAGWSKEIPASHGVFAVLCGDAAHAMPPFLGQGSNQAIQDSYCLAKRIYDFNAHVKSDEDEPPLGLKALLKDYENLRWKPTASITLKACILGYLETGGPDGAYSKFRDVFFRFTFAVGVAGRVLLDAATPKY
jgi:flavin-dependent dehydrogenase